MGDVENACVPLKTGAFLTIAPAHTAPWEGGKKFDLTLEGFPTAALAETEGRRLAQALLWMSISTNFPLRLEYQSYVPAAVFERNRSGGASMEAFAEVACAPDIVLGELQDAYDCLQAPDDKLLLSMEIFCAAHMESSERAIFLAVVSALEPLAVNEEYGSPVQEFVGKCITLLATSDQIDGDLRNSLKGRLLQLRCESIRQALRRMVYEVLPDEPEAAQVVDDAYAVRSQIIHTGSPADLDVDLERQTRIVSAVIRNIYAKRLKRELVKPG